MSKKTAREEFERRFPLTPWLEWECTRGERTRAFLAVAAFPFRRILLAAAWLAFFPIFHPARIACLVLAAAWCGFSDAWVDLRTEARQWLKRWKVVMRPIYSYRYAKQVVLHRRPEAKAAALEHRNRVRKSILSGKK